MFKQVAKILITAVVVVGMAQPSFGMMMCGAGGEGKGGVAHAEEVAKSKLVEVGNVTCPVTGEKIEKKGTFQVEHERKVYDLCCKACIKDFKKNPEKYIKKIGHHEH